MTERCVAVLQARMTSSRLPGKVMAPVLGQPMLFRQIERVMRSRRVQHLVVATSTDAADDALAQACAERGIACYRGSLEDVLDRFFQAALQAKAEIVVRLTGDCPLADPAVIDHVIACFEAEAVDYASNALTPTYPDGLDVEVMRFAALERCWRQARLPSEREHVTPYIYNHPEQFSLLRVRQEQDLSALRWTVDTQPDLDFVAAIYAVLYPGNPAFGMADIMALLQKHPELATLNDGQSRNEGYITSLRKDASQ